jgi:DHA1 family inner membrane transport protein
MATPQNVSGSSVPRVSPDGIAAAVLLSVLATAGFFYVSIMPALVSGLITGLGFSPQVAGRIASCNVYGAALGAFCAVLLVRRVAWRRAAVLLLCALLVLDVGSMLVRTPGLLAVLRLLHGLSGGLLVGICYGVMSRTASADRCFGILMIVQSSLGGLGRKFLPLLVADFGAPVLFAAFAAVSIAALMALPFLPDLSALRAGAQGICGALPKRDSWIGLALALCAVFLFQAGNMAVAAYVIELGRVNGFSLAFITSTIGIANWVATLGALLVVVIGTRFGRVAPIAAGALAALLGNMAFHWSAVPAVFVAASISTAITWFFVIPYLLGLCAEFDRSGRAAALAGLFSKLGLASGPLLAAGLLGAGVSSYVAVINAAIACVALSAIAGVMSTRFS